MMFTGIIEIMGRVVAADRSEGGMRLSVGAPGLALEVGDSVAVNGVCLTAVEARESEFDADLVLETLARTILGELDIGSGVNLERPMAADGRFDGHIVQGHVDGVGQIVSVEEEGNGRRIRVRSPRELSKYIASKGSIALDGISLTVAEVDGDEFEVAVIPHTLDITTLGLCAPGSRVNLEVDVIAKYVERMMSGGRE
ncbi:MAG: riboflavin synthase [Acidimicrobiia bacterium]|nr:riboflavin synthase [Acidimicrobiia bacterium]